MKGFGKERDNRQTMGIWGVLWKEARENTGLGGSQRRRRQRCQEVGSAQRTGARARRRESDVIFVRCPIYQINFFTFASSVGRNDELFARRRYPRGQAQIWQAQELLPFMLAVI